VKSLKITTIGKYYFPFEGGVEAITKSVCDNMAAAHDVRVIAFDHGVGAEAVTINGVDVQRCATIATIKSQPISIDAVFKIIFSKEDVLHLHSPNFVASMAVFLKHKIFGKRGRFVITHHMDVFGRPIFRRIGMFFYKDNLRRSDAVIVTSMKNAEISKDIPVPVNFRVVPLGIDLEQYQLDEIARARAANWRSSLSGNAPLVGFVGRHARYKGLDVLMRSAARMPGVHFVVAGDGPKRAEAESLARELGIEERVHFLGKIDHQKKIELLSVLDVFAFPSTEITEAFGISQVEAMAMGVPVVASDLPTGVTDVAQNNVNALVVPPSDEVALAQALSMIIENRDLRDRLGEAAKAFVYSKLSLVKTVEETARVVEGN